MSKINDGGPAFPINPETGISHKGEIYREAMGMSLRDRIAIEALGGMLSHPARYKPRDAFQCWNAAISEEAYELADAMLAERDRK